MSKLFRVADTSNAPRWINPQPTPSAVDGAEATRIASMPADIDEKHLSAECQRIEQCAASGATYRYSAHWNKDAQQHLREYAMVCKVKTEAVDPSHEDLQYFATIAKKTLAKTAATQAPPENSLLETAKSLIGDPFGLDTKGDMQYMHREDWERIKPEARADSVNRVSMTTASVINIGSLDESSQPRLTQRVPGQNSMLDPNAIKTLSESTAEDTGARLRREAKERKDKLIDDNHRVDAEMVKSAEAAELEVPGGLPRGSVMLTDARPSSGAFTGGHLPDKSAMPDLTPGELLKQKAVEHKAAIQRAKTVDRSWDEPQGAARHEISEVLIDEINKQLGTK